VLAASSYGLTEGGGTVNVTTHSRFLPWKYSNAKQLCQTVNLEYSKLTFWQLCFAFLYCAKKFSERLIRYVAYFRSLFKTSNQAGGLVLNFFHSVKRDFQTGRLRAIKVITEEARVCSD